MPYTYEDFIEYIRENKNWIIPVAAGIGLIGYYLYTRKPGGGGNGETPPPAVGKFKVVIDPGHGGNDPGAVYKSMWAYEPDLREKDINLSVGNKVKEYLDFIGIQTISTRTTDTAVSLETRKQTIANERPDAFVSIHTNSSATNRPNGDCANVQDRTICFIAKDESMSLAQAIKSKVQTVEHRDPVTGRVISTRSCEIVKVNPSQFYILNQNYAPSVIVELGFICQYKFREQWNRNRYFAPSLAKAISDGIAEYLGIHGYD